jgi:hypothetical protein
MEVMISFLLILFCLVPLLLPNIAMYREQNKFTESIKIDHVASLLYGHLLEQLHRRNIPFEMITQKQPVPIVIAPEALTEAGIDPKTFPYQITLTAQKEQIKGVKTGRYIAALVKFTYVFSKKSDMNDIKKFTYLTPIVKLKPPSEQSSEKEEPPEKQPPKKNVIKPSATEIQGLPWEKS